MGRGVRFSQGIQVYPFPPAPSIRRSSRATLAEQGGAEELARRHPLGRIGQPDEVAGAVLWLASSTASFITATDLAVDGGLTGIASFAEPYPPPT